MAILAFDLGIGDWGGFVGGLLQYICCYGSQHVVIATKMYVRCQPQSELIQ